MDNTVFGSAKNGLVLTATELAFSEGHMVYSSPYGDLESAHVRVGNPPSLLIDGRTFVCIGAAAFCYTLAELLPMLGGPEATYVE